MQTIAINARSKAINQKNAKPRLSGQQDLKDTAITARSMDIEPLNADQSLCGHHISHQNQQAIEIITIGITTPGIAATTVRNMDTLLRIA